MSMRNVSCIATIVTVSFNIFQNMPPWYSLLGSGACLSSHIKKRSRNWISVGVIRWKGMGAPA